MCSKHCRENRDRSREGTLVEQRIRREIISDVPRRGSSVVQMFYDIGILYLFQIWMDSLPSIFFPRITCWTLSAAFDMVNHPIELRNLEQLFGSGFSIGGIQCDKAGA